MFPNWFNLIFSITTLIFYDSNPHITPLSHRVRHCVRHQGHSGTLPRLQIIASSLWWLFSVSIVTGNGCWAGIVGGFGCNKNNCAGMNKHRHRRRPPPPQEKNSQYRLVNSDDMNLSIEKTPCTRVVFHFQLIQLTGKGKSITDIWFGGS